MTEIRFHSRDPRRRPRAWKLDERGGRVAAALLLLAGTLVAIGLFGAPDLVTYVVRSAERLALHVKTQRGLLALDSVRLRFERLEKRVAADELFLARVAAVLSLPLPATFPDTALPTEGATATDLEVEVQVVPSRVMHFLQLARYGFKDLLFESLHTRPKLRPKDRRCPGSALLVSEELEPK